jgi:hypothetical protein
MPDPGRRILSREAIDAYWWERARPRSIWLRLFGCLIAAIGVLVVSYAPPSRHEWPGPRYTPPDATVAQRLRMESERGIGLMVRDLLDLNPLAYGALLFASGFLIATTGRWRIATRGHPSDHPRHPRRCRDK